MRKLLPLNIQLFADPEPDELQDLIKEVSNEPVPEVKPETKVEPEVKTEQTDPTQVQSTEDEETTTKENEENKDEAEEKGGIKELREAHKAEKKRAKELEEARLKLEEENRTTKEKLLKAIKLGIKGETEEEILENLSAYEVKEEAGKTGLTEDQVRKEAQLKAEMEALSREKQETLFNKRAYNLQKEVGIDDNQLLEFIQVATEIGVNLLSTTTDFKKIYDRIMGTNVIATVTEKDRQIAALNAEIARLKGEKAPENGVTGQTKKEIDESDWEALIANAKGK